jgi:hypothetical protein
MQRCGAHACSSVGAGGGWVERFREVGGAPNARQCLTQCVRYVTVQLLKMRQAYWGASAEALSLLDSVFETANTTGHLNNTIVILVRVRLAALGGRESRRSCKLRCGAWLATEVAYLYVYMCWTCRRVTTAR